MKNAIPTLFLAAALAWSLAGCASGTNLETTHVLKPRTPFLIDLPVEPAGTGVYDPLRAYTVRGLPAEKILQVLGRPSERATPDVWIYWGYYSIEQARAAGGYDTVIVAFEDGRVRAMKLVGGADLRAHLGAGRSARAAIGL